MNTMIEPISKVVVSAIIAGAIVLSVSQVLGHMDQWHAKSLKVQAVSDCSQTATVSYTTEDKAQVTIPYQPGYQSCMKAKGY